MNVHLHHFSRIKSQSRNQCCSYYFCLMIEGSGSVSLTNGTGTGRPKNIWIRIRNLPGTVPGLNGICVILIGVSTEKTPTTCLSVVWQELTETTVRRWRRGCRQWRSCRRRGRRPPHSCRPRLLGHRRRPPLLWRRPFAAFSPPGAEQPNKKLCMRTKFDFQLKCMPQSDYPL